MFTRTCHSLYHATQALLLGSVLQVLLVSVAEAETIAWHEASSAAQQRAVQSDRPLLVYIGAESCGYCRQLEARTWANSSVAHLANQTFVPVRVDGHRSPQLTQQLGVRAFPTVIALTPSGGLLGRVDGYQGPEAMHAFLTEVLRRRLSAVAVAGSSPQ